MENKYFYIGLVVIVLAVVVASVGLGWNKITGESVKQCSLYLTTDVAVDVYRIEASGDKTYLFSNQANQGTKQFAECGTLNYFIQADQSVRGWNDLTADGTTTLSTGQIRKLDVKLH